MPRYTQHVHEGVIACLDALAAFMADVHAGLSVDVDPDGMSDDELKKYDKIEADDALKAYEMMQLCRQFENACNQAYMQGNIRGFMHLDNGQRWLAKRGAKRGAASRALHGLEVATSAAALPHAGRSRSLPSSPTRSRRATSSTRTIASTRTRSPRASTRARCRAQVTCSAAAVCAVAPPQALLACPLARWAGWLPLGPMPGLHDAAASPWIASGPSDD